MADISAAMSTHHQNLNNDDDHNKNSINDNKNKGKAKAPRESDYAGATGHITAPAAYTPRCEHRRPLGPARLPPITTNSRDQRTAGPIQASPPTCLGCELAQLERVDMPVVQHWIDELKSQLPLSATDQRSTDEFAAALQHLSTPELEHNIGDLEPQVQELEESCLVWESSLQAVESQEDVDDQDVAQLHANLQESQERLNDLQYALRSHTTERVRRQGRQSTLRLDGGKQAGKDSRFYQPESHVYSPEEFTRLSGLLDAEESMEKLRERHARYLSDIETNKSFAMPELQPRPEHELQTRDPAYAESLADDRLIREILALHQKSSDRHWLHEYRGFGYERDPNLVPLRPHDSPAAESSQTAMLREKSRQDRNCYRRALRQQYANLRVRTLIHTNAATFQDCARRYGASIGCTTLSQENMISMVQELVGFFTAHHDASFEDFLKTVQFQQEASTTELRSVYENVYVPLHAQEFQSSFNYLSGLKDFLCNHTMASTLDYGCHLLSESLMEDLHAKTYEGAWRWSQSHTQNNFGDEMSDAKRYWKSWKTYSETHQGARPEDFAKSLAPAPLRRT